MADNFNQLDAFLSGEGGKSSKSGASLLPAPVNPAWYDPEDKDWFGEQDLKELTKAEKKSLVQCSMIVQYSPTNRASCRRCGDKIEKDVLRLGYPFRWSAREDAYTLWLHPECYVPEVFGIKEKELPSKILGYKALNNTEKVKLWKAMRSSGKDREASSAGQAATDALNTKSIGAAEAEKLKPVKIPKEITAPMLPFQKEGLAWMCNQEETKGMGGILADEMGMGKTIQAISLLCARPLAGPALVVVPMAAVSQWVGEIKRFTKDGTLSTMVYHGAQRGKLLSEMKKVNVVVTTYQTLETDYRQVINKTRVPCKWCKKLFLPEKLVFHQKYFCGPDAIRTAKQQRTQKKDKNAAIKGMRTMGIGQAANKNSVYAPPTITNIYKDYMSQAGVEIKASGYWNVRREAAERNSGASSSSSSKAPPATKDDHLSRERLNLLERSEIQGLCAERGLDQTGRKPDLIDRLMEFSVKGMARVSGNAAANRLGGRLMAAAKAKAKAKSKANLTVKGKSSGAAASSSSGSGLARTVASQKAAAKIGCPKCRQGGCDKCDPKGKRHKIKVPKGDTRSNAIQKFNKDAAKAAKDAAKAAKDAAKGKASKMAVNMKFARTVANQRAAKAAPGSTKPVGKGVKRSLKESDMVCQPCGQTEFKTFFGPQLDLSESPLHSISWSRIILDEAHRIKGRTNSTAMAAYALQSNCYKWCLSGTPLQNRVGELYSLIRFLKIRPFAFYYCKAKGCNCECLRFMRDRYCPNCGHVRFQHYSHFKRTVSNPIIKYGYMGAGKAAFGTLRNDILGTCMLRRTKEERQEDLQLPKIKTLIRKDSLTKQESDFYSSLYMQSQVKFDTYIKSGTVLHNYAHIFDLLTSLRRAVDHPYLIVHGGAGTTHKLPNGEKLAPKSGVICGLCQDDVLEDGEEVKRTAKCGHSFHDDCIREYISNAPKLKCGGIGCPVCFTKLSIDLGDHAPGSDDEAEKGGKAKRGKAVSKSAASAIETPTKKARTLTSTPPKEGMASTKGGKKSVMNKIRASEFQSSTKIEALLDELRKMRKDDKTNKAIVFSQFGVMLELVEFALKRDGISCVMFRGGMSMQARDDALKAFNTEPSLKVILISLKAGGEGLNLQVANHVFLLDPWWNPACELQAIQRAHRIGQLREVKAVRFITKNTIEEKILALQEKKQLVFDASIDGSGAALGKLTEQDIKFLFQS
jgi:DNA repair protein RAD16